MGSRYMQPLRITIQWLYLFFIIYLGVNFYRFVLHFRSGGVTPYVQRADGIEGFLPIAALLGIRDFISTGSINSVHPASVVILLSAILVSLLLRRSFCSWICPIGTMEELLWKLGFSGFKRNFRPPVWLDIPLRGIKYLILSFFLYFILLKMTPDAVSLFIVSDYSKIADVRLLDFFLNISGVGLCFISATILLSVPLKSPFCRFLCPYGALLGIFAILSPLRVTREKNACVRCGACSQVCPSHLPVMEKERIISAECVGCWRCISHCRVGGALDMKLVGGKMALSGILFALLVLLIFIGGTVAGKMSGKWKTDISYEEYGRLIK